MIKLFIFCVLQISVFFSIKVAHNIYIYSQTCIKRSPFGTKIKWYYKTGDLLKEVQFI
jgi:hypothetical protein